MMVLAEKVVAVEVEEPVAIKEKPQNTLKIKLNFKKALSLASCLLCLTVGNVIVQGLVVEKNYQIRHLQQLVQEKERDMMKLKINIANLESFERVRTIAQNELGMKTIGPDDYQMIPAIPAEAASPAPVVPGVEQTGLLNKLAAWIGGIGKTMANTF
jgi:cell division protein FtsL